jgi:hypothetical protein|tara:strand:+ start:152 stop:391 length:240 start_codon:yes stop_codon:yes gene_type:complete
MNYEAKVMEVAYKILKKRDFKWDDEFSNNMKTDLLDMLLKYFTDIEHYEKCADIHSMLKQLEKMNENISETNFTGSGIN